MSNSATQTIIQRWNIFVVELKNTERVNLAFTFFFYTIIETMFHSWGESVFIFQKHRMARVIILRGRYEYTPQMWAEIDFFFLDVIFLGLHCFHTSVEEEKNVRRHPGCSPMFCCRTDNTNTEVIYRRWRSLSGKKTSQYDYTPFFHPL